MAIHQRVVKNVGDRRAVLRQHLLPELLPRYTVRPNNKVGRSDFKVYFSIFISKSSHVFFFVFF